MDVLTWLRAQWDRVLGFTLVAGGAVALVIGYDKAAGTRYLAEQITVLISGGLGGIFCLGAGATLLVCADIRDEWRKLDRIEEVLLDIRDDLGLRRSGGGEDDGGASTPSRTGPAAEVSDHNGAGGDAPAGNGAARLVGRTLAVPVAVLGLVGLAIVIGGWQASASTTRASGAIDAASWSAAGLILAGVGAAALIIVLKRTVRFRQTAILAPVALSGAGHGPRIGRSAARGERGSHARPAGDGGVRIAAGLTHFHRQGCAALAGLEADACDRAAAARRLAPCPLCEP